MMPITRHELMVLKSFSGGGETIVWADDSFLFLTAMKVLLTLLAEMQRSEFIFEINLPFRQNG